MSTTPQIIVIAIAAAYWIVVGSIAVWHISTALKQRDLALLVQCALFIVVIAVVTYPFRYYLLPLPTPEQRQAQSERLIRDERRQALDSFALQHVPEMSTALHELEVLQNDLEHRIAELQQAIAITERDPATDEDLAAWTQRLSEVTAARSQLTLDLKDAFLAYRKFILAPEDIRLESELSEARQRGQTAAQNTSTRYQQLHVQIQ